MTTIADIEPQVLVRLEETNPPVFWDLVNEIRPFIVEAMNEAMLISGEPEIYQTVPITLKAGTNVQPMPAGAVALIRLEAGTKGTVRKTSLIDLDRFTPTWEKDATDNTDNVDFWFPLGLNQYGIHPRLTVDGQAYVSYIGVPVPTPRPYTGLEPVPFQKEYDSGLADAGAAKARLKEAGEDWKQSMAQYDSFLNKMGELSRFSYRKNCWRFAKAVGVQAAITDVKVR